MHTLEITIYSILMNCWVVSNFQMAKKLSTVSYAYWTFEYFLFDMCVDFFGPYFCSIVAFFLLLCRATLKVLDISPLIYTLWLSFCTELFAFRLSL